MLIQVGLEYIYLWHGIYIYLGIAKQSPMKKIITLLCFSIIMLSCKKTSESPSNADKNKTVCSIASITLTACPLQDSGGTNWDLFSAPDFYVSIVDVNGTVLWDGAAQAKMDQSTFPQTFNIIPAYQIPKANWSNNYYFRVWEADSPDADDFVGDGGYFNPGSYMWPWPETLTWNSGPIQFTIALSWQ